MNGEGINTIRDFLVSLFSRLPMIRSVFAFMLLITMLYVLFMPKIFTVSGEIIVLSKEIVQVGSASSGETNRTQYLPVTLKDMETEAAILRSMPLIRKTVVDLYEDKKFNIDPSLLDTWVKEPIRNYIVEPILKLITGEDQSDKSDLQANEIDKNPEVIALTKMVVSSLNIHPQPGTSIIAINFETPDIDVGKQLVDQLMDNYLVMRSELMNNASLADVFLQKKQLYKERFAELGNKKINLFNKYEIHNPKEELSLILRTISSETIEANKLSEAKVELQVLLEYLKRIKRNLAKSKVEGLTLPYTSSKGYTDSNQGGEDNEIEKHLEKIMDLQSELERASLTFNDDAIQIIHVREHLLLAKKQLLLIVENRIKESNHNLIVLDSLLEQKQNLLQEFKNRASLYTEMVVREAEINVELEVVNNALYRYGQQYEEQSSESIINKKRWRNVKVLSYSSHPLKASSPKKSLIAVIAIISSLITSVCVGLLCDIFDQRFQNHLHAGNALDLQVFAVVDDEKTHNRIGFSLHPVIFFKWLMQGS